MFILLIEIIQWIKIVLSPLLISVIFAAIVYFNITNIVGVIIGLCLIVIGLSIGIIWATKIWKMQGTNYFISRIMASADLDNNEEVENEK